MGQSSAGGDPLATTIKFDTPKPTTRTPSPDDPETFDLGDEATYATIHRLFYGKFSARLAAAGIEPQDGFQIIVEGLLRRSRSEKSRWDPTRGSLATWAYVAMSGLTINMVDSHFRALRRGGSVGRKADAATWDRGC